MSSLTFSHDSKPTPLPWGAMHWSCWRMCLIQVWLKCWLWKPERKTWECQDYNKALGKAERCWKMLNDGSVDLFLNPRRPHLEKPGLVLSSTLVYGGFGPMLDSKSIPVSTVMTLKFPCCPQKHRDKSETVQCLLILKLTINTIELLRWRWFLCCQIIC